MSERPTGFVFCDKCRTLWLGLDGESLVHPCSALSRPHSASRFARAPDASDYSPFALQQNRVELPVIYAAKVFKYDR